jgi:hypothetical protein
MSASDSVPVLARPYAGRARVWPARVGGIHRAHDGPARSILESMTKTAVTRAHLATSPFKAPVAPPTKLFAVGDRVTHDVFGLGRVTTVEDGIAVLVDFGGRQERIISPYAKLTVL